LELIELFSVLAAYVPDVVAENWAAIGVAVTALVVAAGAVARMTKNTTDDKVVGVVARVVDVVVKLPFGRSKAARK